MIEISFKIAIIRFVDTIGYCHSNIYKIVIELFRDFCQFISDEAIIHRWVTRPSLINFGIDKLFEPLLGITELIKFHNSFALFLYLMKAELSHIF